MKPKIYFRSRIFRLPILRNYSGITLGRLMFFRDENPSRYLIHHEMIHQEQIDRYGVIGFYARYAWEFLKAYWKMRDREAAYRLIPFEKEAYARQYEIG